MPVSVRPCPGCEEREVGFAFTMAFQPVVDAVDRRVVGHEALVRGPAGEGAGSILGRLTPESVYAFDQECRVRAIEMAAALGMQGRLAINFLPNAVYEPRACIRRTLDAARRTGFPADRITFEFVEQEGVSDVGHTTRIIREYKRLGFEVALDDFGTGHSNLWQLAELAPDTLKIDRTLVADCDRNDRRGAIVRGVAAIARAVGTKVVGEGVERPEEARFLADAGIRLMQGFLFARPRFEGLVADQDIAWPML